MRIINNKPKQALIKICNFASSHCLKRIIEPIDFEASTQQNRNFDLCLTVHHQCR